MLKITLYGFRVAHKLSYFYFMCLKIKQISPIEKSPEKSRLFASGQSLIETRALQKEQILYNSSIDYCVVFDFLCKSGTCQRIKAPIIILKASVNIAALYLT